MVGVSPGQFSSVQGMAVGGKVTDKLAARRTWGSYVCEARSFPVT